MTKIENFNTLRTLALANGNDDLVKFIDKEIASLEKKRNYVSPKDKAKMEMDSALRLAVLNFLADGKPHKAGEIAKACNLTSASKATSLLKRLVEDGKVANDKVKGDSLYHLANDIVAI